MRARGIAIVAMLGALSVGSRVARGDVVFRDPNLHCPRGAIVEPTHGPSYCMALACTTDAECPSYQFEDEHQGDCVPLGLCILGEDVQGGGRAPPGTTYHRETAVAACDGSTPCGVGTCRLGRFCVAHEEGPAPPPIGPSVVAPPAAAPPAIVPVGTGGSAALAGGLAGLCGGAIAGSVVALVVALVVSRRRG